jgi:hypothetical protein
MHSRSRHTTFHIQNIARRETSIKTSEISERHTQMNANTSTNPANSGAVAPDIAISAAPVIPAPVPVLHPEAKSPEGVSLEPVFDDATLELMHQDFVNDLTHPGNRPRPIQIRILP